MNAKINFVVTLTGVTTIPQLDPYHRDTSGETKTVLVIDPRDDTYHIYQASDLGATPSEVWHGLVLESMLDTRPDEQAARDYLSSPEAIALVRRVIAGHDVRWDGNNHVGGLDDDGAEALEDLLLALADLPECEVGLWSCQDWFATNKADLLAMLNADGATVEAVAAKLVRDARFEGVVLGDDVEDYLVILLEEEEEEDS